MNAALFPFYTHRHRASYQQLSLGSQPQQKLQYGKRMQISHTEVLLQKANNARGTMKVMCSPWQSTPGSPQKNSWHSLHVRPPNPGMHWHCPVNC